MAFPISTIVTFLLGVFSIEPSDVVYRCKKMLSWLYLQIYKRFRQNRLGFFDPKADGEPEKVGFLAHPTEIQLESPCPESHLVHADDKIFCYGLNSKRECLLVSITRLINGKAEAIISLRLASGKTYLLENTADFQQSVGEKNVFSCGGLQMYYLCPMRRWRIFFSGFLKETSEEIPSIQRMAYVKFSFLWRASSDVYDNTIDMNESIVVDSVAKADWKSIVPPVDKLYRALDYYAQTGVIMGMINVDDTLENYEVYLFGERIRYLGDLPFINEAEFSLMLGYVHKNGAFVHFGDFSVPNIAKNVTNGFVVKPNSEIKNIEEVDILTKAEGGTEEIKGSIVAGRSYAFSGSSVRAMLDINANEKSTKISEVRFYLNGREGTGIYIKSKFLDVSKRKELEDLPQTVTLPELLFPTVVCFSEEACQQPEITGGKGSSLGKLTQLSAQLQTFIVPKGIVVTTSSYKEFINRDILDEIKYLEGVIYGNIKGDEKKARKRVQSKIFSTKVPNNIKNSIVRNLKKLFGEAYASKKFAVRSSATGEDTEQMSAAGQMDTFLGVSGLNNIMLALNKCWASQFGFIAVQYKRRYGQPLNTPMAVVVQEMVQCEVAGVLFTCDPVTGNPTKMSIAANYGLGESVVSGSEEPDAIEISRDHKNELKIHRVTVGSKLHKITVTDDGTGLDEVSESERQECCLSADNALRLGRLAVDIENRYRSRRDIEWGIRNNILYIFQSRPVTSGTQETDFEIEHEMDGPLRVENEVLTVSHTAEVLPGATSTLGMEMFLKVLANVWQRETEMEWLVPAKAKYFPVSFCPTFNHNMFNVSDVIGNINPKNLNMDNIGTMIAFFGRVLEDEELFEIAAERYGDEQVKKPWIDFTTAKIMLFSGRYLKTAQKTILNYQIPVEKYKTSKDLFTALTRHCCYMSEAVRAHLACSRASTMWNMQILSILSRAKNGIDNDVYSDFASLATNRGDVESADVPSEIQSLAFHISKSIEPKEFKAMKIDDALLWLKTTSSTAGKKFNEFMKKHGHRCFKEFDVYFVPWGTDPNPLVQLLQSIVGTVSEDVVNAKNPSILEMIKQLKVPLGLVSKLKLLLLVPMSRKGVREREATKSLFIRGTDGFRKFYRALAKLMVSEGRIPNEDILFFMTVDEIKELLETRAPRILAKAYRREKLYPQMDNYIFPEMMRGVPRPINQAADDEKPEEGLFSMQGLPVSQGVAKGYLRVAVSLEDAMELKPREIMLAYSTDIGWSPYFPFLAGVATELGGLISHGAVVSREYGLPCVAGLHGATRRFQTGDYVLLDGNKGILQKLQPPEEN